MTAVTTNYPGIKTLRRVQLGKEATPGTGVLATTLWRGEGLMQDDTQVINPAENIGVMLDVDRVYIPSQGGTLTLSPAPLTYEQFPYLPEMGIKLVSTGTSDGAGSGKIYNYPFPTTLQTVSVANYSAETGDDASVEKATWALCESIKISGKYNEALMMSGVLKTRATAPNTLTGTGIAFDNAKHITDSNNGLAVFPIGAKIYVNGTSGNNGYFTVEASAAGSLTVTETTATEAAGGSVTIRQWFTGVSVPTVESALLNKSKLYIDAIGSSWGVTQKTGTFLSFDFDYKTGQKGQPAGDGRLDFAFQKQVKPSGTLKITFEHEGTAIAEKEAWRAKTPRLIRILNQGSALTTAGTTYTYKTFILDVVGVWTKFNSLSDDNGNDTIVGELKCSYDITQASAGKILVVNQLASLP